MLEAVGHRYYDTFFATLENVLKPDGMAVLQVITIPDARYAAYRTHTDWIQKHIFPGGHLPALSALTESMTRSSKLAIEHLENIGPHYATTLRRWRARFAENVTNIRELGFDEAFIRTWDYYLRYCEAAFDTRTLNNLHLVLTRSCNPSLGLS